MFLSLSIAREIAYDAFVQVMHHNRRPEDVSEELMAKQKKPLKRIDRNFIKELLFGSLRWHSKLYWILQNTSRRDLDKSPGEIQAALVMGTYQIYYMDRVPDRAAVNESVEYIRKKGMSNACTFVNGILRQIARRAQYFPKPDKEKQANEYLALQFAHPKWIVDRWAKRFKFERMEKLLAANNQPPPNSVRINQMRTALTEANTLQQEMLRQEKTHTDRRPLRCCLQCREFPRTDQESLFQDGMFTIQDEASQLIGYLVDPQEGETIVDACCGPGGKLSHIYELADGKANLIGIEKATDRLELAKSTMERLKHENVEFIKADFASWKADNKVDRILVDAPCSGLGVLRRHPEGKWQKNQDIISNMIDMQRQLIRSALRNLKVGGELVYSVCSFEPEETTQQLAWALDTFEDKIEIVPPSHRLPDYYRKYTTRENVLLVFAGNPDDMDGFGAFILKVNGEIE